MVARYFISYSRYKLRNDCAGSNFILKAKYRKGGVPFGTPPGESIEDPVPRNETSLRIETPVGRRYRKHW